MIVQYQIIVFFFTIRWYLSGSFTCHMKVLEFQSFYGLVAL